MPHFRARSADTEPEAEAVQIELLRRAGPARRAQFAPVFWEASRP